MAFGGQCVGLFACDDAFARHIPGRLVGETVDAEGRRGYVLTLQAREQHIKREKAGSNICTNQTLFALAVAVHLAWLGPEGLRARRRELVQRSRTSRPGGSTSDTPFRLASARPFVREFALRGPKPAAEVVARAAPPRDLGRSGVPSTTTSSTSRSPSGGRSPRSTRSSKLCGRWGSREQPPAPAEDDLRALAARAPRVVAARARRRRLRAAGSLPRARRRRTSRRSTSRRSSVTTRSCPSGTSRSTTRSIRSARCTMKYNPKVNDEMAALPGFRDLHPDQPAATSRARSRCCTRSSRTSARSPGWTRRRSVRRPERTARSRRC